jgi:hypothetical protein
MASQLTSSTTQTYIYSGTTTTLTTHTQRPNNLLNVLYIGIDHSVRKSDVVETRSSKKRKLYETSLVPSEQLNPNPSKRLRPSTSEVIEFLEHRRQLKHPSNTEKKAKSVKKPRLFKNISLEMQAFIVYLRYESTTQPGEIKRSFKVISGITRVH